MNQTYVAGLHLSLILITICYINLLGFVLWTPHTHVLHMAVESINNGPSRETVLQHNWNLFWPFWVGVSRCPQAVQLQNERILPYDIITKPLVLKPDMSSNLHIGHLNHKINIGLRLALTDLINWSLIINRKYGLRSHNDRKLGSPKKLIQNGI